MGDPRGGEDHGGQPDRRQRDGDDRQVGAQVCAGSFSKVGDAFSCDLDWSTNYTVSYDAKLGETIDSTWRLYVDAEVKASIIKVPLKFDCALCGADCTITIPIVKQTVPIPPPPCPITGEQKQTSF